METTVPPVVLACPKCGSANLITRRDGVTWCRKCGHEAQTKEFEK